jgi:hypothetical protein
MALLCAETPTVPALKPIAVEGETVFSLAAFLPFSLLGLAAAMYAHGALGAASCSVMPSTCRSANGVRVRPLGLGLAASRYPSAASDTFSASQPAVCVAQSGVASSSGREALEVYEIIAAGALPYVLDLCAAVRPKTRHMAHRTRRPSFAHKVRVPRAPGSERLPQYALSAMPKHLLARVRQLPHLPPPETVAARAASHAAAATMRAAVAANDTSRNVGAGAESTVATDAGLLRALRAPSLPARVLCLPPPPAADRPRHPSAVPWNAASSLIRELTAHAPTAGEARLPPPSPYSV